MRFLCLLLALIAAVAAPHRQAMARDDAREEICATEVAQLRNIGPDSVRLDKASESDAGYVQIPFRTAAARGACVFDSVGRLIDVRFSGGTGRWDGSATGSISSQQSACAGELARRFNIPLSSVIVSDVVPEAAQSERMVVSFQGARALCSANSFNAITLFEMMRD
jgi:hypothetical protein